MLWLAMLVLAAGCGAADDDIVIAEPDGGRPTLESTVLSGSAMTIAGESFDLGALTDSDLVVWFWAPW